MQVLTNPNKNILLGINAANVAFGFVAMICSIVYVSCKYVAEDPRSGVAFRGIDGRTGFVLAIWSILNFAHWIYQGFLAFKWSYDAEKLTYITTSTSFFLLFNFFAQLIIDGAWYFRVGDGSYSSIVNSTMRQSKGWALAAYSLTLIVGAVYMVFLVLGKRALTGSNQQQQEGYAAQQGGYVPEQQPNQPNPDTSYYAAPVTAEQNSYQQFGDSAPQSETYH